MQTLLTAPGTTGAHAAAVAPCRLNVVCLRPPWPTPPCCRPPCLALPRSECFLDILCGESGSEFVVEEAGEAGVRTWEASKQAWRTVPVALMHLRRAVGGDTVGVKLPARG